MPDLIRHWMVGPARACRWKHGLPLPGHRTMKQVIEHDEPLDNDNLTSDPTSEEDDEPRPRQF